MAYRPCDECLRWLYDRDGQRKKDRGGQPVPRPASVAPPCWDCPKTVGEKRRSPEVGRQAEWTERNWQAWAAYWEHQAAGGETDDLMRRNFGIIAEMIADHQRTQQSILLAVVCGGRK